MRFSHVVMAYFLMGAIMWGGGVIAWDNAGITHLFVQVDDGEVEKNTNTSDDLERLGGPIQEGASSVSSGGGLLAIWNMLVKLIGYLFWPITVMLSVQAPPRIVVLAGGTPTVAFYAALARVVRGSA